ncbi:MAG TPA: hypothetical protein VFQ53_13605 [Kofleriaceae bacterium]|nr:hypothetical protein [Kofleriaceae bacterium]
MARALVWMLLGACTHAAPVVAPSPPPPARIEITGGDCPSTAAARDRIAGVLAAHGATHGDLAIRVTATGSEPTEVRLVVERGSGEAAGSVGLDRAYTLAAADCTSAPELLALAVDRFLSAFPEWAGPPPVRAPVAPPARWVEVTAESAVSSLWAPIGIDGQAGAIVDVGGARDRLGGSLLVRASLPQAAGNGSFQQTAVLAGIAYRHRAGAWALRAEARAGAVRVTGMGFTENASDWLPWWEGAVFGGRAWSWGSLGLELAASGLRHVATTRDGLVREDIPALRVGLGGEFQIR